MFTYLTTILLVVSITAQGDNLPVGGGIQEQKYVVSDSLTIIISDPWLLAGSLELLLDDSLLSPEIDYLYEDSQRLITFLPNTRALPDDFITVKYISVAVTDSLHYQRFYLTKPNFFTEQLDSATYKKQTRPVSPFSSWQGMRRSGSITRGVRFGGGSDGGVTSGLHLELSGSPKLGVNVQAIIDDRNMPATRSGSSTSLAELDKLLFQVTTPHLKARLGDWDLVWDNGRYTTFERRLKGGNIAVDYDAFSSDVAAGGGNNTFNTSSLRGRDGDLGPYELTDKNGVPGITVISGSEKVYLNGSLLKRGRRADYVIDYSRGRITFNPRHPIRSDSRIEVEYEYSDDIYPRYFYAASGRVPAGDGSGLSFSTAIISEGRDKENPLAFEWTEERRRALEAVGDDPYSAVVPGIDSVGADQGDYVWGTADDDSIVVFSQPDSLGHPTGYLDVVFSQQSGGGYTRIYEDSLQAFYYEWVGAGVGDWAPVQRLPLPDKTDIVDVITNYKTDRLMMSVEAAFSSYDRNTLSSLNDDDNNGAAWLWNGMWNADDAKNLTLQASVRHEDERFHHINRSSEVDYSYNWNLPEDSVSSVTEVNSNGSFSPRKSVRLSVSGGYLESGSHYRGSRLGVGSVWDLKRFSLSSSVDRTDGDNKLTNVTNQRLRAFGSAYRKTGSLRPSYSVGLEKNQVGGAAPLGGNQFVEHASGIEINLTSRQQLDLCFNYRSDDKLSGSGTKRFSDTRSLNGDWRVKGLPWGGLSLNMLRYYQTYSDASLKSITSTAAGMETAIAPPKSQWRLKVNYNLVTGSDRGSVQVANYVGDGSGGYRREGDRYVPDPDGDFDVYEAVTDTLQRVSRVDFSGQLNRDFRKHQRGSTEIETYPFGVSGVYLRFEANLKTTEDDPLRAFLLYPPEFNRQETILARRDYLAEVNFLEGNPVGDGKLSARRIINRNAALADGESSTIDRISFLSRHRLADALRLQLTPGYERSLRSSIASSGTIADVTGLGIEAGFTVHYPQSPFEYGLTYSYQQRRDREQDEGVDERRLTPRFNWTIGLNGRMRIEGTWRYLTANSQTPGYDLWRGWAIGNNWTMNIGLDYSIGANVTATAFFRGRWEGDKSPHNSGLIEFSAKL